METMKKVLFAIAASLGAILSLVGAGCSRQDTLVFTQSPLEGVWGSTHISRSEALYKVIDDDGVWVEFVENALSENISPSSSLYTIIKFTEADLFLMKGSDYISGTLGEPYPYTITDGLIESKALAGRYQTESFRISDISSSSFTLTHERSGWLLNGENDTICESYSSSIIFSRLK